MSKTGGGGGVIILEEVSSMIRFSGYFSGASAIVAVEFLRGMGGKDVIHRLIFSIIYCLSARVIFLYDFVFCSTILGNFLVIHSDSL
jgi:hypothetical protein